MDTGETTYAKWEVDKGQVVFVAVLVTVVLFFIFVFSAWSIYIVSKSTNILFLIVPVIFLLLFLSSLPELFKSLQSAPEAGEISVTSLGVYRKISGNQEQQFIPWGQMVGYDLRYLSSTTPVGKLFPRPTQFILKSKYEEDNFLVDAFGEDTDTLRAYLKENNVPFGFLKNS